MHHLSRFVTNRTEPNPKMKTARRRPKLERQNAVKNIEYDARVFTSSFEDSATTTSSCSLELLSDKTSFRIEGNGEGEFDRICQSLGLSGIEDFAIPAADWAALKLRSTRDGSESSRGELESELCGEGSGAVVSRGIRGVRPPPVRSTWETLLSRAELVDEFSPEGSRGEGFRGISGAVLSGSYSSFTTSNGEVSSCTSSSNVSPNGRFRREICNWQKGRMLGSGSFGTVYEGIADDGFFFALKEVSLLDQGSEGKQRIFQLEQEIALLSQFEHENIVQYYGTDKDESKLYIFLELVSQGSLLSLYQRYNLRDSQVSAYTRQILHGLKYLHDQNVVHRDIKCANILVDANGSVKLADFGLAKATKLNDVKSCKGTAFWMAPEVVNQKGQGYGLPADIWSLGCTVLELLTGQIPYSELECMQALFRIGKGIPPSVPESLSLDARDFILQCLKIDPTARPSATQLLDHPFVMRRLSMSSGSASPYIRRHL